MNNYVVIFGNLATGIQTIHGPFANEFYAKDWAERNRNGQTYYIFPLK